MHDGELNVQGYILYQIIELNQQKGVDIFIY